MSGMGGPMILSVGIHLAIGVAALHLASGEEAPQDSAPIEFMVISLPSAGAAGGGDGVAEAAQPEEAPAPAPAPAPRRSPPKARPSPPASGLAVKAPEPEEEAPAPAPAHEEVEDPAASLAELDAEAAASGDEEVADSISTQVVLAMVGAGGSGPGLGLGIGVGRGVGAGEGFGFGGGEARPVEARHARIAPRALGKPEVSYPLAARSRGIEGVVRVRMIVDREGRVEAEHTRVVESIPALDTAAIRAANRMRFQPGRDEAGRAIRVIVEIPIHFRLD